ncbi:hypothetical protein LXL04_009389 [Taraxacum kok-saghyz]
MVLSANESLYRVWASRNRWSEDLRCDCDEPATFSISRTDENPGRSFRGCPNFKIVINFLLQLKSNKCDFFMWLDPPLPNQRYKETMWKLYVELDQEKASKEMHMQMLKVLKLMLVMMVVMLGMLLVLLVVVKKD